MFRTKLLGALLLAAALLGPTIQAASADGYALGIGDKLRIKVHEWPDLSGEYSVSPGATVSLPVLGDVPAAGITSQELARRIAERLQQSAKLSGLPSSTVEIIEFRPFFVMGDVQNPGKYPYRPGLTVLQAVSIAGGYYRPSDTMFRLERDAISARGDILVRAREVKQLAARIARLEAEQQEAAHVAFPPELDASPSSPDLMLMQEEQAIFAANKEALAKTLATLDRYLVLYEQEIEAIRGQIDSEKRQLAAVKKELEGLKSLADRGLTSLSRQLASERTVAQIESTMHALDANILRARQNISQTEQRRVDVLNNRTDRINTELQKARADAKETDYRLKTARDLLMEAEVIAPALYAANGEAEQAPEFTVARSKEDKVEEISVDRMADVLPGDVLTIKRRAPFSDRQTGTRAKTAERSATD